jgi:hypothetical protein
MFLDGIDNPPILHGVDTATGWSMAIVCASRDLDDAVKIVEERWFTVHGPPRRLSGDQEFNKAPFKVMCDRHHVEFLPRPARRHNKSGVVERGNQVIKLFARRFSSITVVRSLSSLSACKS